MPQQAVAVGKTVKEIWTLPDEVDELRGKLNLRDQDRQAYFESSQVEKHQNEEDIFQLRRQNKENRKSLAESVNADEKVIKTVFQSRRDERLSMQRFTAPQALEYMDQKVCERIKQLNALRFQREEKERRLQELHDEFGFLVCTEDVQQDTEEARRQRQLENNLDKTQIKVDTARNISTHYETIVRKLKEESLKYPGKLDAMEDALRERKTELQELKQMNKEAQIAAEESRQILQTCEQIMMEENRKRHQELNATRKEVERRKDLAEKTDRKANRATLITDPTHDHKAMQQKAEKREQQENILMLEEGFDRIKEATNVTSIAEIFDKFQKQKETNTHLNAQKDAREKVREQLKEELATLVKKYHSLRYSGEKKMSSGEQALEGFDQQCTDYDQKHERLQTKIEKATAVMVTLKTGVATLLEKLSQVKCKPPARNYPTGDVVQDIGLLSDKLDVLTKELGIKPMDQDPEAKERITTAEFHEFVERQLPPENLRINIVTSQDLEDDFDYSADAQADLCEELLTREDIKRMGQNLLDAKLNKKKRRGKKK